MSGLTRLWVASRTIGFVPTALCAMAWLVGGALAVGSASAHRWPHPGLGYAVVCIIALLVACGGLVSFWLVADHVDYLVRGYRISWIAGTEWLYEERANGVIRGLPFRRVTVGDGYPSPFEVRIASEAEWEATVPGWASGRRAEITGRIAHASGADAGGRVTFVDV